VLVHEAPVANQAGRFETGHLAVVHHPARRRDRTDNASMRSLSASNSNTSTDAPNMRSPHAQGVTLIAGAPCALELSSRRVVVYVSVSTNTG
jgi:hypothetical protein